MVFDSFINSVLGSYFLSTQVLLANERRLIAIKPQKQRVPELEQTQQLANQHRIEQEPQREKGSTLDVLKELLSRREDEYTTNNPLRIKVPESELLSGFFNSGDPFPDEFDGTSTDTDDGPTLAGSAFTAGDKVAVQVWFGSYNFNNRTGPIFRLLKLWKLQPSLSEPPSQGKGPITPRKRRGLF